MFNKATADRVGFYGDRSREVHQHERADGFTLIEILIATSVLTLGLVGILALFPVAIKAGRTVVEASNSVVIAQSVVDAIRSGIRNSKGLSKQQGHAYFILRHDGVTDTVPSDSKLHDVKDDYYILLPRFKSGRKFPGARGRVDSLRRGKLFLYPETDRRANGGGNALAAARSRTDSIPNSAGGKCSSMKSLGRSTITYSAANRSRSARRPLDPVRPTAWAYQ